MCSTTQADDGVDQRNRNLGSETIMASGQATCQASSRVSLIFLPSTTSLIAAAACCFGKGGRLPQGDSTRRCHLHPQLPLPLLVLAPGIHETCDCSTYPSQVDPIIPARASHPDLPP